MGNEIKTEAPAATSLEMVARSGFQQDILERVCRMFREVLLKSDDAEPYRARFAAIIEDPDIGFLPDDIWLRSFIRKKGYTYTSDLRKGLVKTIRVDGKVVGFASIHEFYVSPLPLTMDRFQPETIGDDDVPF